MGKRVSTTALAKRNQLQKKELFSLLEQNGLIQRVDGRITLTSAGKAAGGDYKESRDFGAYVAWPEEFDVTALHARKSESTPPAAPEKPTSPPQKEGLLTATAVGKQFGVTATKCNYILSELGWLKKGLKGWLVTPSGARLGGQQSEDFRSGVPYVKWPTSILDNRALVDTMGEVQGLDREKPKPDSPESASDDFRNKFPATHRAADGHMVRSRAEMLIDNWLYMAEIVHAYERKLPIEEDMYCDFYIPTGKVYIEFWGLENDPKYQARKAKKQAIYEKYGFNLIELGDADVQNLDDILPRHLLKYGVQAY